MFSWRTGIIVALLFSCQTREDSSIQKSPLFTLMPSSHTGITFVNNVQDSKDFNIFRYRNLYNGGGVAIGDINNDGLPDVFFTANMGQNRLYLNKGGLVFEDITTKAGVGGTKPWDTGVTMVDINADGLLDIYVCNAGNREGNNHDNDLFINNGDLTFSERAEEFNLAKSGFSTHAAFFDYDKDGDLDAYILNNSNVPVSSLGFASDRTKKASDWVNVPPKLRGIGHMLLRNDGGKFGDVSEESGIYGSLIAFGLGVLVTDINDDTYPDIYVSNDFYERDYLYINQRNGKFSEEIKQWTSHLCLSAMGVDIADINNDGLKDVFITDMLPEENQRTKQVMEFDNPETFKLKQSRDFYQQYIQNTLQFNNGNGTFSEIALFAGVGKTDWSWSGLIFDMDNDSFKDIYVTNGIIHDLTDIDFVDFLANDVIRTALVTGSKDEMSSIIKKMPVSPLANYAFANNGNLTFTNNAQTWGLAKPGFSNGCAYADLDIDGDLDLIVNNVNMEAFVYRNESNIQLTNNYLRIQLKGEGGNSFAIGAIVKIFVNGQILLQELMPSRGFQSSVEYPLTFGVGKCKKIDSLSVLWPDNRLTLLTNINTNQTLELKQSDGKPPSGASGNGRNKNLFFDSISVGNLQKHIEDEFDDFDQEGLIVKYLSKEGPACAGADVNSDGFTDLFVGGAKGEPGNIFVFDGRGRFLPIFSRCFAEDRNFEDVSAVFADVDGDLDQDLVVGSGGNVVSDALAYGIRLYLNDGIGNFVKSSSDVPVKRNVSVIAPSDIDNDGDLDLFVGCRSVPGVYGVNPRNHLLLINDGAGKFTDETERLSRDFVEIGMVTDAVWADIDGDRVEDLVTVSDWGTPAVFKNTRNAIQRIPTTLDSLSGWWESIAVADIDSDGDNDLILGNSGLNIPYVPTTWAPVKLWVNDFDQNGTVEQIFTISEKGKDYPIHMRRELMAQLPSLKKRNLKAHDYSKRTITELFEDGITRRSLVRMVNTSRSICAINKGGSSFAITDLPIQVQWSNLRTSVFFDVNEDGYMDVVTGGNNFDFKPQFSRQDANFGSVLLGDGKGGFRHADYSNTGFFVRGQIRKLVSLYGNDSRFLVAVVNSGEPKVFKHNSNLDSAKR
jgi:enediyne biosynthesis protein E4